MLLQLEGDIVEQEAQFQQADVEAKSLAGHRASAVAEEERARKDVLNLAVLVANTEDVYKRQRDRCHLSAGDQGA